MKSGKFGRIGLPAVARLPPRAARSLIFGKSGIVRAAQRITIAIRRLLCATSSSAFAAPALDFARPPRNGATYGTQFRDPEWPFLDTDSHPRDPERSFLDTEPPFHRPKRRFSALVPKLPSFVPR